jgi:hypothetical protein
MDEATRILLMQDEPPAGVEMTVSMRALWLALRDWGYDHQSPESHDAFEALWAQIAAERPDGR